MRTVAKSFSWLLVDKFVGLGSAFLVSIALARVLGPGTFGTLNYVMAWATLMAPLSALGLNQILTREFVASPEEEGKVLGTTFVLSSLGSLTATGLVSAYLWWSPTTDDRISLMVVLLVGATCLSSLSCLEFWFIAKGKTATLAMSRMLMTIFFLFVRGAALQCGAGLETYVIIAASEVAAVGLRNYIGYLRVRSFPARWIWDLAMARSLLSRSWPMIIGGLTSVIYLKLDTIMMEYYSTAHELGIYSVAARLSELSYFLPTLLMSAAFPPLLELKQRDEKKYWARLQDLADHLVAAGTIIALGWMLTGWFLVPLVFGDQYSEAVPILMVHSWAGVFIFGRAVVSKWIVVEELFIFSLVTQLSGAIANAALNVFLIPRFGGLGAAYATLISYAVASYGALLLSKRSWPAFALISRSLLWPRRLPEYFKLLLRTGRIVKNILARA